MWILNVRIQDQFLGSQYFLKRSTFPWISRDFYISIHIARIQIIEIGARRMYNNLMNFISTLESTLTAKKCIMLFNLLRTHFFSLLHYFHLQKADGNQQNFIQNKFVIIIFFNKKKPQKRECFKTERRTKQEKLLNLIFFFSFLKIKSRAANKHKREGESSFS